MTALALLAGAAGAWTALAALAYTVGADLWYRAPGRRALRSGPPGEAEVALTFDDGPDPVWSPRIAALLESEQARGTFFVLASRARQHPDVVRRLLDGGHEVALHGYDHLPLWLTGPRATCRRLEEAVAILRDIDPRACPRFYRPPWGHFNLAAARCAQSMGMRLVLWSSAPPDWAPGVPPRVVADRVAAALRPGAIVDLHDGGRADRARRLFEALPEALRAGRGRGLRFVTLSRLLDERDGAGAEP